ncbi:class I SAM-dependent methyltransferase [Pelotomaculum propionicicum]|uniref:class I SAM-dependent methyltransferase n=1 Tax=Pelotomaculum propionicicum TaxID=258475 RepID=UPI003B7662D0
MANDIKLFYDLTAQETADQWYGEEILKPTVLDFVSLLPAKPRVLDLGCGPGHESMRIAQTGAEVLGVDFSGECISIARARCPQCRFEVMDFRDLDGRYGSFDGVFAAGSMPHLAPGEIGTVLKKIRSILTGNGYAAIIVVDGEGISEKFSNLEVDGRVLNRTFYLYTRKYITEEAKKAGLKFVREGYLDPIFHKYGWRNYIFR